MRILALLALLAAPAAWAGEKRHHHPEENKDSAGYRQFDRLRSLLGEWEGKGPEGGIRLWYKLVSGGSALVETEKIGDEPEMITVYHIDDDALMLTHYCSANNQPRMHAEPSSGPVKEIRFKLDGVSNLKNSGSAYMNGLIVTFQDDDHLRQRWFWLEAGKEKVVEFKLTRKKPAAPAPAAAPAPVPARPA